MECHHDWLDVEIGDRYFRQCLDLCKLVQEHVNSKWVNSEKVLFEL